MPVYNERNSIEKVINKINSETKKISDYEFIICEDGSNDGTDSLLRKLSSKYSLVLSQKNKRRGYGRAIIDGINLAKSKYILFIDSDGQYDPKDIIRFWSLRDKAEVIKGWRKVRKDAWQRKAFSFLFKLAFGYLFTSEVKDPSCPLVLCKRSTALSHIEYLKHLDEGFWWGFSGMVIKKRLKFIEIPINHRERMREKKTWRSWAYLLEVFTSWVSLGNISSRISWVEY